MARSLGALGLSRLGTRLLLLVLLAAVPVFAVQVYGELEQRDQRREEVAEQVQQMAELVAAQLDRLIESAEIMLATLGDYPAVRRRDGAACAEIVVGLTRRFPHLAAIAAATPAGELFCSSDPGLLRANVRLREYVQRAVVGKTATVSDLIPDRARRDQPMLAVALPILNDEGMVETVMILVLYPEKISNLLAGVPLPEDAVIGVIDRTGAVVARVPYMPEIIGRRARDAAFGRTLFSQPEGAAVLEGPAGLRRIYGFARSGEAANLAAYVGFAQEPIFEAADRLFRRELALLAAGFILAAGVALWFASRAIRQPVLRVRDAIDRMAHGDLSARADPDRSGIEELAGLARSFDEMARQRMRAEERQRVLMRELNHRIKNNFALVQSLAAQTLRHSASLDAFERAFLGRLDALARVSTLLTTDGGDAVDLRALAEAALEPFRTESNLRLSGPEVALPAATARALSLALHELATNAAKYGALSAPDGRVELAWRLEDSPRASGLAIVWTERGGPEVRAPNKRGFGCTLIERSVAYELDGTARLEFPPEGVRCRIELPFGAAAA